MDPETRRNQLNNNSWRTLLTLAFQSLGVVYGDLSTSPLYVYRVTFSEDIRHSETNEEIFGVLSLIFWTLTLLPLLKYTLVVLRADDNGEGGTFALYSLLCRHANVNLLPNSHVADEDLSNYRVGVANPNDGNPSKIRAWLMAMFQNYRVTKKLLLLLALIGACMVIGDGILTPALSVFSAVSGLEFAATKHHHQYIEVPVACVILIALFALQHYGTHRVGFLFAPVVVAWLLCISAIGLYNICYWNPLVFKALSPHYIYIFLKKNKKKGWMSLGGILLCMTGSEAMFADLGHFSQKSIKLAFTLFVYPSLVLAYLGQAAYLSQHHELQTNHGVGFYISVPEKLRWPVSVIAVLAAVVGSQAIITGTFSIIKQCSALSCFPRVKIVHTSSKYHGQIYIPEINWILMLLCLAVTVGFRDTRRMGNASGLAVITVMLVTTCLMSLVIVLCWRRSILYALLFGLFFGAIEALYFSASLMKFVEGAWVPVAIGFGFLIVMLVWQYGTLMTYEFEVHSRVTINWLVRMGTLNGMTRVNGIGVIHTELVTGIPAMFSQFIAHLPAFHQVLIFLCVKSIPVPHVDNRERFLIGHVGPKRYRMYRIIVRYGYRDAHRDDKEFEDDIFGGLAEFVRGGGSSSSEAGSSTDTEPEPSNPSTSNPSDVAPSTSDPGPSRITDPGPSRSNQGPTRITDPGPSRRIRIREPLPPSRRRIREPLPPSRRNQGIRITEPEPGSNPGASSTSDSSAEIEDLTFVSEIEEMMVVSSPSTEPVRIGITGISEVEDTTSESSSGEIQQVGRRRVQFVLPEPEGVPMVDMEIQAEFQGLMRAREFGMSHIMSRSYVRATSRSGWARTALINLGYGFLVSNCRDPIPKYVFNAPNTATLEVGTVSRI